MLIKLRHLSELERKAIIGQIVMQRPELVQEAKDWARESGDSMATWLDEMSELVVGEMRPSEDFTYNK